MNKNEFQRATVELKKQVEDLLAEHVYRNIPEGITMTVSLDFAMYEPTITVKVTSKAKSKRKAQLIKIDRDYLGGEEWNTLLNLHLGIQARAGLKLMRNRLLYGGDEYVTTAELEGVTGKKMIRESVYNMFNVPMVKAGLPFRVRETTPKSGHFKMYKMKKASCI
jgi:hypothetical protein